MSELQNENIPEESAADETEAGTPPERRPVRSVFEYVEMFVWAFVVVLTVFTFVLRLCNVEGKSMENTLHENERLLLYSIGYTPKQDDIVVFQLSDYSEGTGKRLIKRVIATGGQTVVINTNTNMITVDGVDYADSHSVLKDPATDRIINIYNQHLFYYGFNPETGIFTATVPEGYLFVMGDNRNNSRDSRDDFIGFVDERVVLGKAILRFRPFTVFS